MQILETVIELLFIFVPGVIYYYVMNYQPKDMPEGEQPNE